MISSEMDISFDFSVILSEEILLIIISMVPDVKIFLSLSCTNKKLSRMCLDEKIQETMKTRVARPKEEIKPISRTIYFVLPNGEKHGKEERRDVHGKIYSMDWKNGRKNGLEEHFDSKTGGRYFVRGWKNGLKNGICERFWYTINVTVYSCTYINGRLDGVQKELYENGKTKRLTLWDY